MKRKVLIIIFALISLMAFAVGSSQTVYVTKSGAKYHRSSCRYVSGKSNITSMSVEDAKAKGYTACSVCF